MTEKQLDIQGDSGAKSVFAANEFEQLLQKEFKPKTEEAKSAVNNAVATLAQQALQNAITISDDTYQTIEAIIAELDRKLSEQINLILHHEDFQKLEGEWRGLHHLVTNTETDTLLKIKVLPISKKEVARNLKRFKGTAWDQSPYSNAFMKKNTVNLVANLLAV